MIKLSRLSRYNEGYIVGPQKKSVAIYAMGKKKVVEGSWAYEP